MTHTLTVLINDETRTFTAPHGANLRRFLLEQGITPYTTLTQVANCGGRGICATCGVWIETGEPAPRHWHDRAAAAFGYPRLSCQISIESDMSVRILTDKVIWGGRDPERRYRRE
ncbi:MAG: 2Fe-2S iron-sulfur cluster binding domain-containing protein [Chloroflexota bacterium]|nr:2Fe-2S iron-sulfur cluster binding domain-containing protein [Chloroflexota bacterium]